MGNPVFTSGRSFWYFQRHGREDHFDPPRWAMRLGQRVSSIEIPQVNISRLGFPRIGIFLFPFQTLRMHGPVLASYHFASVGADQGVELGNRRRLGNDHRIATSIDP